MVKTRCCSTYGVPAYYYLRRPCFFCDARDHHWAGCFFEVQYNNSSSKHSRSVASHKITERGKITKRFRSRFEESTVSSGHPGPARLIVMAWSRTTEVGHLRLRSCISPCRNERWRPLCSSFCGGGILALPITEGIGALECSS